MDLWYPPKDAPHLFEWWRPLVLASRAAREAGVAWPIHVDEHHLRGRIDRKGRPAIWVYAHEQGGELYLDATGQAYRFTRTPNGRSYGRFTPCGIEQAIWRAGLPEVVEPLTPPELWSPRSADPLAAGFDDRAQPAPSDPGGAVGEPRARTAHPASRAAGPRRRGHLTVIDGGRSLAG